MLHPLPSDPHGVAARCEPVPHPHQREETQVLTAPTTCPGHTVSQDPTPKKPNAYASFLTPCLLHDFTTHSFLWWRTYTESLSHYVIRQAIAGTSDLLLELREKEVWNSWDRETQAQGIRVQVRPERAGGEVANGLPPAAHREPRGPWGWELLARQKEHFQQSQERDI